MYWKGIGSGGGMSGIVLTLVPLASKAAHGFCHSNRPRGSGKKKKKGEIMRKYSKIYILARSELERERFACENDPRGKHSFFGLRVSF